MNIQTGIIDIRGKQYQTVALRVQLFRDSFPLLTLATDVVHRDAECVVMKATISDETGRTLSTGHAEEKRSASQINKTSALENAETSAIGRALAGFGFGGTEFATANEVENAIHQQAAGGQSQQGTVSPRQSAAPKKEPAWREPDSVYSTPTALHKGLTAMDHHLNGCGDSDMVYAVTDLAEWKEFVRIADTHSPHYLRGGDPAPPEFEGLLTKAERLVREFDSATANNMTALAGA